MSQDCCCKDKLEEGKITNVFSSYLEERHDKNTTDITRRKLFLQTSSSSSNASNSDYVNEDGYSILDHGVVTVNPEVNSPTQTHRVKVQTLSSFFLKKEPTEYRDKEVERRTFTRTVRITACSRNLAAWSSAAHKILIRAWKLKQSEGKVSWQGFSWRRGAGFVYDLRGSGNCSCLFF